MLKTITGSQLREMLRHGVSHLAKHAARVNDLNVFPVPDGDTGTNMVMTMRQGLDAIRKDTATVAQTAHAFAAATVFGARGNSGVIVSQFFRGMSEGLSDLRDADCAAFIEALDRGCDYAYAAVAKPVEGTLLTVLHDATDAVLAKADTLHSIDAVIDAFLAKARISLDNTPKLLPILKKAGVVDSGGAGMVYFFEGVQRYLRGEAPTVTDTTTASDATADLSHFHKNSDFSLGYCTEVLLQLTGDGFEYEDFRQGLAPLGDSLVSSLEGDKVKVHIHTPTPENILAYCHGFGEFLSLKIENMSVQHSGTAKKLLRAERQEAGAFAVVAVAPNPRLQALLAEMGADVVIASEGAPSSQEFLEAYALANAEKILVFPNSANSVLSAAQAASLYQNGHVTVLNCRSIPECYASLALLDFDNADIDAVAEEVHGTIEALLEVSVVRADRDVRFGDRQVAKNDYFALLEDEILLSAPTLAEAVLATADALLDRRECGVITLFFGKNVTEEDADSLARAIEDAHGDVEVCLLATEDPIYDAVLSFE